MRKLMIMALCLVIVGIGAADYVGKTVAFAVESNETYVVKKGDTLWAIAINYAPRSMDVRDYIYRLRVVNNLTASATIHPGQELVLPKR
ncbi:MAG: LysM domain-containing protein [Bacillota bacterium]|nr:LysM domain-containing protein [Bacillota bacterium]